MRYLIYKKKEKKMRKREIQTVAQRGQNIQNFLQKNYFLVKCFTRILLPSYSVFEKTE